MGQSLEEYIALSSAPIGIYEFIINILLTAFLTSLLGLVYVKYGNSLSNRKQFSRNFIIISMTTMLVITIVKSSLALSLGLVGALSIVRFRAAIKEPEELGFLFLAIAIGLGLGANQVSITLIATTIILLAIVIIKLQSKDIYDEQSLNLIISSSENSSIDINILVEILKKFCTEIDLKRLDESAGSLEAAFQIEIENLKQIDSLQKELKKLNHDISITFLDNKGVI